MKIYQGLIGKDAVLEFILELLHIMIAKDRAKMDERFTEAEQAELFPAVQFAEIKADADKILPYAEFMYRADQQDEMRLFTAFRDKLLSMHENMHGYGEKRSFYVKIDGWDKSRQVRVFDDSIYFQVECHSNCDQCKSRVQQIKAAAEKLQTDISWVQMHPSGCDLLQWVGVSITPEASNKEVINILKERLALPILGLASSSN